MAYRVLIIPGDNEVLRALQGQLAGDIEVQVLDSANEALWEVRNSPPEVIVADVQLPGMSGLDLAEILPNFGVPTKVVLWSREPNRQAAKQAAGHGVHRFLNGPVSGGELQSVLYEALGMQPPAEAPALAEPPAAAPPAPAAEPPAPAAESPASESLAARARPDAPGTTAAEPARPAPTPAPPAPASSARRPAARRREGSMFFTADSLTPIRNRMDALSQDVGSQCIMLTDRAGMVLTEVGSSANLPMMILLPLLSTSFSTAGQVAQMLHETDSTALYMHEGSHYDLYCFDVLQRFMLVIVFDKAASAAKIGSVWVYAKRAIRDLQEFL